jgi:uncharacterized membrane protein
MYQWMIFLHMVGLFLFLMAHGISAGVALSLRKEHRIERLQTLLGFSGASYSLMYGGLLLLLISGIVNGFIGHWWGSGWIWLSIILLVAIIILMVFLGSRYFTRLRQVSGVPYMEGRKIHPPQEPGSPEQIEAALKSGRPMELALIGFGGLLAIAWLMIFKPF